MRGVGECERGQGGSGRRGEGRARGEGQAGGDVSVAERMESSVLRISPLEQLIADSGDSGVSV